MPISQDVTKIPFGAGFGLACLARDAVLCGDLPRWSRLAFWVTICLI